MSFKPAIMTGVFSELKPEESIKRLADIGWRYFEFYSVHMAEVNKREDPKRHFLALRKLCEKLGVFILAAHDNTQGVPPENLCSGHKSWGPRLRCSIREWMKRRSRTSKCSGDGCHGQSGLRYE